VNEEYKLCYVDEACAWFTTQDISKQWGDDWNDAPYEHNAGAPYQWRAESKEPEYRLYHVYFEAPMQTPADRNISLSVEQINAGASPWLQTEIWALTCSPKTPLVRIDGGTPYPEFVRLIESIGGIVFVPKEAGA
jgi:hypothetical protein